MIKLPGKKAHFGDDSLQYDIVPGEAVSIGDWAYASCRELTWIAIPDSLKHIGKAAFEDCEKLYFVYCYRGDEFFAKKHERSDDYSRITAMMNAAAVRFFPDPLACILPEYTDISDTADTPDTSGITDICDTKDTPDVHSAGISAKIADWDTKCLSFINTEDDRGFLPFLAGGEEDYDEDEKARSLYCHNRRFQKAHVIFIRLLAGECCPALSLNQKMRDQLLQSFRALPESSEYIGTVGGFFEATATIYEKAGLIDDKLLGFLKPHQIELRSLMIQKAAEDKSFFSSIEM